MEKHFTKDGYEIHKLAKRSVTVERGLDILPRNVYPSHSVIVLELPAGREAERAVWTQSLIETEGLVTFFSLEEWSLCF